MVKRIFISLSVLLLIAGQARVEAFSIRINTPKIELELSPGETYSGEVIVENPTSEPMQTRIYLEDWAYEENAVGDKIFSPAGSTPQSASPWINFRPSEEILQPFGRIVAQYTVRVPEDARGSNYSVLFFETIVGETTDEEGASVLVTGRIGALFYIYVRGTTERSGAIEKVDIVPPAGNSPLEITTAFRNTGNTDIALEGNFLVLDASGSVSARGELMRIYTGPGQRGERKTEWVGRLAPGSYDVILTYDLGKGVTIVKEKTIVVE